MKIARIGEAGCEFPVLVEVDGYRDLRGIIGDLGPAELTAGALTDIAATAPETLPLIAPANGVRLASPVRRPGAILGIGLNYGAHAAESGAEVPDVPVLFLKPPSSVGGPDDPVAIPRGSVKTDWEVELAVVIGRPAYALDSPADSAAHIGGYLAANDVSERDYQLGQAGGQWAKGKSSPGFTPLGPWLVTPDELDPRDLRLRSWVNGEPRQDSTTADLVFPVDHLIWHLSHYMLLEPGDVILTGTPEGVALSGRFPYLSAGDVVEIEVEGLGRQRQEFTGG